MCGIVGYVGKREAYPILIKGLHRLEYRGYDSAGIALVNGAGRLNVYKCKGKVAALEHFVESKDLEGSIGIAHTRWATHGEPNDANAHPHYSESENIALIHNGIIENYRVLKDALTEHGYTFRSNTDSEVLVNLIEYVRATNGCTLLEAVQQALKQVIGAYAIAIIEKGCRDRIIAARKSSPMVVGIGEGEYFLGSDAASIVEYTNDFVYVNDGEVAIIDRNLPLKIVTLDNRESRIDIKQLELSISQLEKGGYPHFMLKEIYEQPKTIVDCIRGRVNPDDFDVRLSGVIDNRERFLRARRIIFVACGTSWHASLIGEHLIENICRIPVEVEYASEFRYRNPILEEGGMVVVISQSGETADTLAALREARARGFKVLGIVNVVGSSISREADNVMYTWAGPEIAVATTKAYSAQLVALYLLAMKLGRVRGQIRDREFASMIGDLRCLPDQIELLLNNKLKIQKFANRYIGAKDVFFIGRGIDHAISLEGSLKLKEISYIHSEAYAAGELKHGTISLIEEGTLVAAVSTQPELYAKTISNMVEVKARGAFVLAVTCEENKEIEKAADYVIYIPETNPFFANSLAIIPLQLFGYYVAVGKGCDVDKPRNLAKSVTVE